MRFTTKGCSTVTALALCALPMCVFAHHSMAEFDRDVTLELEGELVDVLWRNPHVLLWLSTTDENGAETTWELESNAVSAQRRRGITGDLVQAGQRVRVAGSPSTRRDTYLQVHNVLLPDGVELLMGGGRIARWSGNTIGGDPWNLDPAKAAAAEGEGIFRVWSRAVGTWYFGAQQGGYRLTPEAAAASAAWDDIYDNPIMDCIPPGMPALMGNPYPMEFVQASDVIELRFEEFDMVRSIHLDSAAEPADVAASPLGYSVGRWEEDTLMVTTTRINWHYFDRVGAPQSPDVVIEEAFRAVDDGERLEYLMTVTDPSTLLEPYVWEGAWEWRRGEEVGRYDCTLEG
ncbi:MAG: DUF6152 family protein [Rhodospirillaceae bacterium]|nr:DUF6152 family protein [Rhodospirillaceae bacterium]MDD9999914.1 DUF6152 family protein [Rhodospirillaceae bacterium]MDE0360978.1 DUF6152 family protein [Rhodospirillaceae bacterium]